MALIKALDQFSISIIGVWHAEQILLRLLHAHQQARWVKGSRIQVRHCRRVLLYCQFYLLSFVLSAATALLVSDGCRLHLAILGALRPAWQW